jgi:hypothetical protein
MNQHHCGTPVMTLKPPGQARINQVLKQGDGGFLVKPALFVGKNLVKLCHPRPPQEFLDFTGVEPLVGDSNVYCLTRETPKGHPILYYLGNTLSSPSKNSWSIFMLADNNSKSRPWSHK